MIVLLLCLLPLASADYNATWSKYLDAYSAITHCSQQQITSWQCKLCGQVEKPMESQFYYNKVSNVLGYSGYLPSDNVILFVWRGTVDAKNWIEDLSFAQIDFEGCRGCKVHEGFYLSYESVAGRVKSALNKIVAAHPDAKLVVTGSSMGAALAIISALDLVMNGYKVDELHAFGCPRVANPSLAQFINQKIPEVWRVIHNRDIVPHVPLLQQNYHHPSTELFFDEKMQKYRKCDQSGEDPTCALSMEPGVSIEDHITYWYQPVKTDICTL